MDGLKVGTHELLSASCKLSYSQDVKPHLRGNLRILTNLQSIQKRQGHARALMLSLCSKADILGIVLMLNPKPEGDESMTTEQLMEWYEKFGFVKIQDKPIILMARPVQSLGEPNG
jgi:hypothetical protein